MRKFRQDKLWRDKAVEMLEKRGSIIHWQRLDDAEYDKQLREKLLEESAEVHSAKTKEELLQELADVMEVIDALAELYGVSHDDIVALQTKKREERGGFSERKFVAVAEHPRGSMFEQYCLAQPEKYPEVIE